MSKEQTPTNAAKTINKSQKATHFGFATIPESEKAGRVRDVFDSVAGRYDLMNDLMSLGIHRLWKSAFIDWLNPGPDMRLLDVGGGTGDIAFKFLERGGAYITLCDINVAMLMVGRDRAINKGYLKNIDWVSGDAENLPVPDGSFDAYTTAFCIRNVTNIEHALAEAYRVLRPGGRFLCLEFGHIAAPLLKGIYDAYSFRVLPALGELVAGDGDAYQYLAESIRRFPEQKVFGKMIFNAGFERVKHRNLSGGIAAIHSAWRL